MAACSVGREPGQHTTPRSSNLGSNWVTHTPTRSPCTALDTGLRNICMDFTFLVTCGNRSVLFRTTTMPGQVSSPISRHSAVWVWMPFTTSTTNIISCMLG
ncbi:hypothetical protein CRUP_004960 [Coryphaenoides rupestris]|nr:hypothetical protein CRUP_004960 [Coryphaenoides rupestris]